MLIKVSCALTLALCFLLAVAIIPFMGQSWRVVAEGEWAHSPAISSIRFTDSKHGLALTPASFLETDDGGTTWREQAYEEYQALYSFAFANQTTGWAVGMQRDADGYRPVIMRTDDGGKRWRRQAVDAPARPNARVARPLHGVSFCNPNYGWAVGSGLIFRTVNGGETWEPQLGADVADVLQGVECVSRDAAWAVGEDGVILKTEDGGTNWARDESLVKETLLRVRFAGGKLWALGLNGTLLRKAADKEKWERQTLDLTEALFDIAFADNEGWIVGSRGTLLYSTDNGSTWRQQKTSTDNDLISLCFLDQRQGWIGGTKRTVLRMADSDRLNVIRWVK